MLNPGQIAERFDSASNAAVLIRKNRRADADGSAGSPTVEDGDPLSDYGCAGFDRLPEAAFRLADVCAKDILAGFAQCPLSRNPGDLLSGPVERRNSPLFIDGEN